MTLSTALAYWTGLAFVAPDLPLSALLGTAIAVNACNAIMCRLFAHNGGYPKNLWTLLGLVAGVWALALLILLPARRSG
jgi:ABC-type transport system involved in cytochrome c biogenesis permease subunit